VLEDSTWPKHDPATSTGAAITEKISAEARQVTVLRVDRVNEWELSHRYSRWTRLVRVTAYVRRFVANLRRKKHSQTKKKLPIQVSDSNEAAEFQYRRIQRIHIPKEWTALSTNAPIPSSSASRALKPVMGAGSLLRLGGRLRNAKTLNIPKSIRSYYRSIAFRTC